MTDQNSQEWIEARRRGLGGSDLVYLFGLGYVPARHGRMSQWDYLAQRKLGTIPSDPGNRFTERGHNTETAILAWAADHLGVDLRRDRYGRPYQRTMQPHGDWAGTHLFANTDGELLDGRLLEAKTCRPSSRKRAELEDGQMPSAWVLQTQAYLAVTGLKSGVLVAWSGPDELGAWEAHQCEIWVCQFRRHPEVIRVIEEAAGWWWAEVLVPMKEGLNRTSLRGLPQQEGFNRAMLRPAWKVEKVEPTKTAEVIHKPAPEEPPMTEKAIIKYKELEHVSGQLQRSGYFDVHNAAQAFAKVCAGAELGIPPFQALSQIHIVKGKPSLSYTAQARLLKASGKYDYRIESHTEQGCTIVFFQLGADKPVRIGTETYTIEMAQKAGLLRNPTWSAHPRNMLFARCLTNGIRFHCPDALSMAAYDEYEAEVIEAEFAEVSNQPTPKAIPVQAIEAGSEALRQVCRDKCQHKDVTFALLNDALGLSSLDDAAKLAMADTLRGISTSALASICKGRDNASARLHAAGVKLATSFEAEPDIILSPLKGRARQRSGLQADSEWSEVDLLSIAESIDWLSDAGRRAGTGEATLQELLAEIEPSTQEVAA